MRELLAVTSQREFDRFCKELVEKTKKKSPLRPSSLTEVIQLMHARSLWPSVMAELTEKFIYKQTECYEKVMEEEENWTTLHPRLRFSDLRYKFVVVEVVVASHFACDSHHTEHEQSNNMNFHN